jgi:hypothetical protein
MVFAADYPFLDVVFTIVIFCAWVVWIWMMILILSDVFRRRDISGWGKAAWIVFLIIVPFVGVLAYLIAQHDAMTERRAGELQDAEAHMDDYLRSVAADQGSAAEIEKAVQLRERGAISQTEFEAIKAKALA